MNCRQAGKLFGAYWDDELTQAEREWLEAHFVSCAECRRGYEDLTRTLELVGDLPRVEISQDFADRVLVKARRRAPATDRVPAAARGFRSPPRRRCWRCWGAWSCNGPACRSRRAVRRPRPSTSRSW